MTDSSAMVTPEWEQAWAKEFPSLVAKQARDQLSESRQWERAGFRYGFAHGQRSRDAEVENLKADLLCACCIMVGVNALCKLCGDSIQKCFHEQCCMGCNHTSDQLPPALRHMEGCCE